MNVEKICGNCAWFDPYDNPEFTPEQTGTINSLQTSSEKPMYGKCSAQHIGADGKEWRYDFGTFNVLPCQAVDNSGNTLFALGVYPKSK